MSLICHNFVQNNWKRDICSNCFKTKSTHDSNNNDCFKLSENSGTNGDAMINAPAADSAGMSRYISPQSSSIYQPKGYYGRTTTWRDVSTKNLGSKNNSVTSIVFNSVSKNPVEKCDNDSVTVDEGNCSVVDVRENSETSVIDRDENETKQNGGNSIVVVSTPVRKISGILKEPSDKGKRKVSVGFKEEVPTVIGYGGQDDFDDEVDCHKRNRCQDSPVEFSEEDKAFSHLTEKNTEYNSVLKNFSLTEHSTTVIKITNGVETASPKLLFSALPEDSTKKIEVNSKTVMQDNGRMQIFQMSIKPNANLSHIRNDSKLASNNKSQSDIETKINAKNNENSLIETPKKYATPRASVRPFCRDTPEIVLNPSPDLIKESNYSESQKLDENRSIIIIDTKRDREMNGDKVKPQNGLSCNDHCQNDLSKNDQDLNGYQTANHNLDYRANFARSFETTVKEEYCVTEKKVEMTLSEQSFKMKEHSMPANQKSGIKRPPQRPSATYTERKSSHYACVNITNPAPTNPPPKPPSNQTPYSSAILNGLSEYGKPAKPKPKIPNKPNIETHYAQSLALYNALSQPEKKVIIEDKPKNFYKRCSEPDLILRDAKTPFNRSSSVDFDAGFEAPLTRQGSCSSNISRDQFNLSFEEKLQNLSNNLDFSRRSTKRQAPKPPPLSSTDLNTSLETVSITSSSPSEERGGMYDFTSGNKYPSELPTDGSPDMVYNITQIAPTPTPDPDIERYRSNSLESYYQCSRTNMSPFGQLDSSNFIGSDAKSKPKYGKFSLKKFLKFGAKDSGIFGAKDSGIVVDSGARYAQPPQTNGATVKPKLEIIHPMDLNGGARVEINPGSPFSSYPEIKVETEERIATPKMQMHSFNTKEAAKSDYCTNGYGFPTAGAQNSTSSDYKTANWISSTQPKSLPSATSPPLTSQSTPDIHTANKPLATVSNRPKPPPPPRQRTASQEYISNSTGQYGSIGMKQCKPTMPPVLPNREVNKNGEDTNGVIDGTPTEYANLGNVRSSVAPKKPERSGNSSFEESEISTPKMPVPPSRGIKKTVQNSDEKKPKENGAVISEPEYDDVVARPKSPTVNQRKSLNRKPTAFVFSTNLPPPTPATPTNENLPTILAKSSSESECSIISTDSGHVSLKSRLSLSSPKNLEESYCAVVASNHEALSGVLDQMSTRRQQFEQDAVTCYADVANSRLALSDFDLQSTAELKHYGCRTFVDCAIDRQSASIPVTLMITNESCHPVLMSKPLLSIRPITSFHDLVPAKLFSDGLPASDNQRNSVITVYPRIIVQSLQEFASKNQPINEQHSRFVLLQLVHGLKQLQAHGIEEIGKDLDDLLVVTNESGIRLVVMVESSSRQPLKDCERITLCQAALKALMVLFNSQNQVGLHRELSKTVEFLQQEKATSLTKAKSILEFLLWAEKDLKEELDSPDYEKSSQVEDVLQRWLDLERANTLNKIVRLQKGPALIYSCACEEDYRLGFLVCTNPRNLKECLGYVQQNPQSSSC